MKDADPRPRIFINGTPDGRSATWARHPSARGNFATSPGAALDHALAEIGATEAVVIWNLRAPTPG